jgi:hypothetical protein
LFDHGGGDHALEESALGLEALAGGQVIQHDGYTRRVVGVVCMRGAVDAPDWCSFWLAFPLLICLESPPVLLCLVSCCFLWAARA